MAIRKSNLKLLGQGKTCDIYKVDDEPNIVFFNRTNRFSIGDRSFPGDIFSKGIIDNQMSIKWMEMLKAESIVDHHIVTYDPISLLFMGATMDMAGSAVAAENYHVIPLECIVRGYYVPESSSWNMYKEYGEMYGNILPLGLKESERLPKPIYTPTIKAKSGDAINISYYDSVGIIKDFLREIFHISSDNLSEEEWNFSEDEIDDIADDIAYDIRTCSLKAYEFAHEYALSKGIILADAKLEFGIHYSHEKHKFVPILIDEVFTPNSARFWKKDSYKVGQPQFSMDKQFLRRYVYQYLGWTPEHKTPHLPESILMEASNIYMDIYSQLFGSFTRLITEIFYDWHSASELVEEMLDEKTQMEIELFNKM